MSSTSPKKAPLAIDQTAHESTEGWTATAGEPVKFEKLGPMVVNSDGTLSRITNWAELSPIERERTMRLLVKKRNIVRMEQTDEAEGSDAPKVTLLKQAQAEKEAAVGAVAEKK